MSKMLLLILAFTALLKPYQAIKPLATSESELKQSLLDDDYDTGIPPIVEIDQPVIVHTGLSLIQLVKMDPVKEQMTVNIWYSLSWQDSRLNWNSTEQDNINEVTFKPSEIWVPDVLLHNSANGKMVLTSDADVLILSDNYGNMTWTPPVVYWASCIMDLQFYPFDVQRCSLKFGSWSNHVGRLDLELKMNETSTEFFQENSQWTLHGAPNRKHIKEYPGGKYADVTYSFVFSRNTGSYMVGIVIPIIIYGLLTIVLFYLPADSGGRLTVCLSTLISVSLFQMLVMRHIPESTKDVPIIMKFLASIMILVFISIFLTTCILRCYTNMDCNKAPKWLHVLILDYAGKIVFWGFDKTRHLDMYTKDPDSKFGTMINRGDMDSENYKVNNGSGEEKLKTTAIEIGRIKQSILREWRIIGMILDRVCLWLFSAAVLILVIWFLTFKLKQGKIIEDLIEIDPFSEGNIASSVGI